MESTLAVQSIPLSQIMPSPYNPRHFIKPEAVDALAASFHAVGQETPIKVRPLAPEERLTNPGFEYELVGGHIRLEAAKKLGWGTLYGIVLPLSPAQTELAAILDNKAEDMHWLDWYQAIERRLAIPSKPTQQQIAIELGVSQQGISRAVTLMRVLNGNSRAQIYQTLVKTAADWELKENPVFLLTQFKDPELVEKALQVLIERQITESEAKKLVKWVKSGRNLEDFVGKPGIATAQNAPIGAGPRNDSSLDPNDPLAQYWEPLPDQVQVTRGQKGYRVVLNLAHSEAVPVVYGAMSNWEFLKGLCGEEENQRYRISLPKVHQEAVPLRKKEKAALLKAETDRKAALEAKAAAKARKTSSQSTADSSQAGERQQPKTSSQSTADSPQENRIGSSQSAVNSQPIDEKQPNEGNTDYGFLGKITDFVEKKTGLSSQDLKQKAGEMLAKDAKQAVNYQIRKGMRDILKDLF